MLVDVHAHLGHSDFDADRDAVIARARAAGLGSIITNGLDPDSNRFALELADRHPLVRAALGIYPLDGIAHLLPGDFPHEVARFDVDAEIAFIREQALAGCMVALGEVGMDGYWVDASTFPAQEKVFEALIGVALETDLPLIVHSRKAEQRCLEILAAHGCQKVVMHCFGGRVSLAKSWAESRGWAFSIPANARVNEGFAKMLRTLPPECILTETDCPYLSPVRGERNEPANVGGTVEYLGELRGWDREEAEARIAANAVRIFGELESRCVVCGHPADLDYEGLPVCRDCWHLQGSVCNGPLYRLAREKKALDAGAGAPEDTGAGNGPAC